MRGRRRNKRGRGVEGREGDVVSGEGVGALRQVEERVLYVCMYICVYIYIYVYVYMHILYPIISYHIRSDQII